MNYERVNWENNTTPLNASNLNKMDEAIAWLFENGTDSVGGKDLPIGSVIEWHSDTLPTDGTWLWTDHEYLKTDYPDLYAFCGNRFNKTDTPSNKFRTPNRAGLVAIGVGSYIDKNNKEITIALGDVIGEYEHTQSVEEMPSHNHEISYSVDLGNAEQRVRLGSITGGTTGTYGTPIVNTGGDQPFNVTQPSVGVKYIIKAVKSTVLETGEVVNSLATPSTTNAPSINAVNQEFNKNKLLVYSKKLTSETAMIDIYDLNLDADGGIYDIIITANCNNDNVQYIRYKVTNILGSDPNYTNIWTVQSNTTFESHAEKEKSYGIIGVASASDCTPSMSVITMVLAQYSNGNKSLNIVSNADFFGWKGVLGKYNISSNYYKQSDLNVNTLKLTCENGNFQAGTSIKIWRRGK